jgi:hypothetical protein
MEFTLGTNNNSCAAFDVKLSPGGVNYDVRYSYTFALCE